MDTVNETRAIDSLSAHEFTVLLDGETVQGVFRITGMTPFKLESNPAQTKLVRESFTLAKLVQRDAALPFNRWLRATIDAKDDIDRPMRTLEVVALDEGEETRRWVFKGAWIASISYSDFNSSSAELVEEIVQVHYADLEVRWGDNVTQPAS